MIILHYMARDPDVRTSKKEQTRTKRVAGSLHLGAPQSLLEVVLERYVDLGLSDAQLVELARTYWDRSTPVDALQTVSTVASVLSSESSSVIN